MVQVAVDMEGDINALWWFITTSPTAIC